MSILDVVELEFAGHLLPDEQKTCPEVGKVYPLFHEGEEPTPHMRGCEVCWDAYLELVDDMCRVEPQDLEN